MFHSDIWSIILNFVNLQNRLRIKCVSHKFNQLINESYSYQKNLFTVSKHLNYDTFTKVLNQNRLLVFQYDNVIEYDMCFIPNVIEFCPIVCHNFILFEAFKVDARANTIPAILITIRDMDMGYQRCKFIQFLETLDWKYTMICILYKFRKDPDHFVIPNYEFQHPEINDNSDDNSDDHVDFIDVPVYEDDFAVTKN